MIIKNEQELKFLRRSGQILGRTLALLKSRVKPGVSAYELDQLARAEIAAAGARPAFLNYRAQPGDVPFPAALCVSLNDEIVHGIPVKEKILRAGDIVSLDLGLEYQGLFTDAAITVPVGRVDAQSQQLIEAATQGLEDAIGIIAPGQRIGDIGAAIEAAARQAGFEVVRDLVGHGVGRAVHEAPEIPCFGKAGTGAKLTEGLVIAVEPMVNAGTWRVMFDDDQWTIRTQDGGRSAHMEHTLLVTKQGCEVLTRP